MPSPCILRLLLSLHSDFWSFHPSSVVPLEQDNWFAVDPSVVCIAMRDSWMHACCLVSTVGNKAGMHTTHRKDCTSAQGLSMYLSGFICQRLKRMPAGRVLLPDRSLLLLLQSTQALPFGTIVVILVIWALVTIPLCILGGIMGKNNRYPLLLCHLLHWHCRNSISQLIFLRTQILSFQHCY